MINCYFLAVRIQTLSPLLISKHVPLGENQPTGKNASATLLKIYIHRQNKKSYICYTITACS